jgi:hypothetical protein
VQKNYIYGKSVIGKEAVVNVESTGKEATVGYYLQASFIRFNGLKIKLLTEKDK